MDVDVTSTAVSQQPNVLSVQKTVSSLQIANSSLITANLRLQELTNITNFLGKQVLPPKFIYQAQQQRKHHKVPDNKLLIEFFGTHDFSTVRIETFLNSKLSVSENNDVKAGGSDFCLIPGISKSGSLRSCISLVIHEYIACWLQVCSVEK